MTRSIFTLLATIFISLGAQFAYAQPERGMGMDPEKQIKELITQLDITTEQEPAFREAMGKVNAMNMESMGQMRGMREGQSQSDGQSKAHDDHVPEDAQAGANARGSGRGMEMMAQRRAEMEEKTQAILAPVLSSAQLEKFKELEAARMEKMMSRMQRR